MKTEQELHITKQSVPLYFSNSDMVCGSFGYLFLFPRESSVTYGLIDLTPIRLFTLPNGIGLE